MISILRQPIVFDGTKSPVKSALFVLICAAWILPGLIGHDPWKPDEATVFGVVYSMLRDGTWLLPNIAGTPAYEYPPLFYWLSGLIATLLSPVLSLHNGARLTSGLLMVVTLAYTYKTATRLFDERAGRISVLLLIGCLGMFLRGHELNPEVAGLAGLAVSLYGLTRIRSEPRKGGVTTGLGAGIIALSVGLIPALVPLLISLTLMWWLHESGNRTFARGIGISVLVALPFLMAFPLLLASIGQPMQPWLGAILGTPPDSGVLRRTADLSYFLTVLPWYALPALPLAVWLWWKERSRLRERFEIAMPLIAFAVLLIELSLFRKGNDAVAMVLIVPLALGATNTPDRLPRGFASFMDWFGMVFFGSLVFLLWTLWAAALTGIPRNFARWALREAPGFEVKFLWLPFIVALALTLVWLFAVARAHRNNRRAIVNWASGLTMFWVLLNIFGLPAADHVRSYRNVVAAIDSQIAPDANCISQSGVADAQRASLYYFASMKLQPAGSEAGATCDWLITQGTRDRAPALDGQWKLVWEGARPGDNSERLRLFRR
jgi:4-amino-4-deoxy-L-arabinose transferase-like glycosyltransferase